MTLPACDWHPIGRIQEDSVVSLLSHAEAALQRVEQKRIQVDMLLARLKVGELGQPVVSL